MINMEIGYSPPTVSSKTLQLEFLLENRTRFKRETSVLENLDKENPTPPPGISTFSDSN